MARRWVLPRRHHNVQRLSSHWAVCGYTSWDAGRFEHCRLDQLCFPKRAPSQTILLPYTQGHGNRSSSKVADKAGRMYPNHGEAFQWAVSMCMSLFLPFFNLIWRSCRYFLTPQWSFCSIFFNRFGFFCSFLGNDRNVSKGIRLVSSGPCCNYRRWTLEFAYGQGKFHWGRSNNCSNNCFPERWYCPASRTNFEKVARGIWSIWRKWYVDCVILYKY